MDSCLACRHLHGHQGKVKLFLGANNLKHGMVTDFKHTNIFKKWLDDTLDHKFITNQGTKSLRSIYNSSRKTISNKIKLLRYVEEQE